MRLVVLSILGGALAAAQEDHARHEHAVAGLGTVNFPASCNAPAQKLISRGAALLHSFGYEEARMAFNEAAKADPTCGMAHWGVARTWYHPIWAPPSPDELKQGAAALDRAMERRREDGARARLHQCPGRVLQGLADGRTTRRARRPTSRRWPRSGNATRRMTRRRSSTPCSWSPSGTSTRPTRRMHGRRRAARFSTKFCHGTRTTLAWRTTLFIAWITRPSPSSALKAARAYAKIAPDSPHALHMPSHIFTRLGLWDDSIASNTVSAKSAIAQAQRLRGGGGAFDQLHAIDYLVYAYLQQAKDRSAQKVLAEMAAITKLDENQFAAAYAFAASPARWALERHDWKAAAALEVKPAWFPWNRFRNAEALVHYAKAIGAARGGDAAAARRSAEELAAIRKALPATRDHDWSGSIGSHWEAATALIAFAEGKKGGGPPAPAYCGRP